MSDCATPNCPTHLQFPEMIEEVQEVRAAIGADGTIGVLTWRTAKLRCADCGAIEIVREPGQHFILKEFSAEPDGIRAIAKRFGVELVGPRCAAATIEVALQRDPTAEGA
jgi:hypothetical protein